MTAHLALTLATAAILGGASPSSSSGSSFGSSSATSEVPRTAPWEAHPQEHRHPPGGHAGQLPAPRSRAAEIDRVLAHLVHRVESGLVRSHRVGGADGPATLTEAVARSEAGDTIVLPAGIYRERVHLTHPVVLIGEEGAVLDGGGEGSVLRLDRAPGSVVRGLTIRGSGRNLSREDSGILATRSPGIEVAGCVLEEVLFGVYLKESAGARILGNRVTGHDLEIANRGDAIRLWYSAEGRVEDNVVRRSRDVVIWFSDAVEVRRNTVEESRYGIHYMYSDHGRFSRNRFSGNLVGAFLMYSTDLRFTDNTFAFSRGASGMGLGMKDTEEIEATGNLFLGNAVGIHLDNSPQSVGATNLFRENALTMNGVGVSLLPSVEGNRFAANTFDGNLREVVVSGAGDALGNLWTGNHWSRYAGFDRDGDGVGDTPFVASRLSDRLLTANPELELFALSPAAAALDVLARVLPFLEPAPVVIDSLPALKPPAAAARAGAAPGEPPATRPGAAGSGGGEGVRKGVWAAVGLLLLAGALGRAAPRLSRLSFPPPPDPAPAAPRAAEEQTL